ncbi:MAG: LamG domain-containing protein [Anaerolineales bacterium]
MNVLRRPKANYNSRIISSFPLIYFPLDEVNGSVAKNWGTVALADGTYTGVSLRSVAGPKGALFPYFDAANDYVDIYSAPFAAAVNADLGTLMLWFKAYNSGVWTDSTIRYCIYFFGDDNNKWAIYKSSTNNLFMIARKAAGTWETATYTMTGYYTSWYCAALTWDASIQETKGYMNGVQVGSTITAKNFVGSLSAGLIGAASKIPVNVWNGYIAHLAMWDRVLTAEELLALSQ